MYDNIEFDFRTSASSNPKLQMQQNQGQSNKHPKVARLISLQYEGSGTNKGKLSQAKLKRMKSLPVEEDVLPCTAPPDVIRGRADTLDSTTNQRPFFKRLLSVAGPRYVINQLFLKFIQRL